MSGRLVLCQDAVPWLLSHPNAGPVVTSPPGAEMGPDVPTWAAWFREALDACLVAAGEDHPAVFYVTDQKHAGALLSKAWMVFAAADRAGRAVLWHKIALRRDVGKTDIHRPTYCHVIAVGSPRCGSGFSVPGSAVPDVIQGGARAYNNGMGIEAARLAVLYAGRFGTTVLAPFCGHGTVLAAAEEKGLRSVGIDNDPAACRIAETLQLPESEERGA